jgi:hypothetical protein
MRRASFRYWTVQVSWERRRRVAQSERLLSAVVNGGAVVKNRGESDPGRVREDLANEEALAP